MKRITLAILVLTALAFGLVSCDGGASGGETIIGKWFAGTNNGTYMEFLSDGAFNNYHSLTNSMAIGKYTYTMDGELYVVSLTDLMWNGYGPNSTTLHCTIDGNMLYVERSSYGWNITAWYGAWFK